MRSTVFWEKPRGTELVCRPVALMAHALRIAAAALMLLSGCYRSHVRSGTDGAVPTDAGVDARVAFDAIAVPDGGTDSGPDAELDAGQDAGDRPPPPPPHPTPGDCRIGPEIYPFRDPVLEYRWPTHDVVHTSSIQVCSTPLVIDLEPEGDAIEPVLVFISYASLGSPEPPGVLRIVDPRTDTTVSSPAIEGEVGVLEATSTLAAGDIDGDGQNEIVGIGVYSSTYAFRSDGSLMWESPYPTATDRGLRYARSIGGAPTLADLEGDGTVEVIIGRNVLDGATGERHWTGADGTGRAINSFLGPISCVADLDGDGIQEVIAGHTAFRANGEVYWDNAEAFDGLCAVADILEERPGPEVILVASGYLRILDGRTGALRWQRRLEGRVRMSVGGAPTVADFDGDRRLEIGVAHGAAYGVYDPSCTGTHLPPGCLDEGLLWVAETADDSSSGTGSSVFDFNGDGRAEVVYNDQFWFRVYDGVTGRPLFQHRNSSRTRTENPTIADVDNDGDAEIVFSANAEAYFLRDFITDPGVEVWGGRGGRWVGARRIWNQHAYHITNVEEDGTIPSPETSSWTVLNAYRQNLREGGDALAAPDLWGGHGSYECIGPGRAVLSVRVQNWGLERAGAGIVVGFYRGRPGSGGVRIGQTATRGVLSPRGGAERVSLTVDLGPEVVDWYALIDDPADGDGAVTECREENNEVLIWRPSCP